jgi:hypothetical protein
MITHVSHELAFRGSWLVAKLNVQRITVCGVGAVGSNLVDSLTRIGATCITVVDKDRVESSNLGTQCYSQADIGALKADAMKRLVFRNVCANIESVAKEMTEANAAKFLRHADLVVDAFDNVASRQLVQNVCRKMTTPCLHIGLSDDGFAEVVWDTHYKIPKVHGEAPCDYPLARSLVMLAVTVAVEEILSFCGDGGLRRGRTVTLRDMAIRNV